VRGPARRDQSAEADGYDLQFLNASADLSAIADSLVRWKRGSGPGPSLCLHGPPGTGKTAYVHHLGRLTGRTVVARKVSDLVSAYVGESEKNIADAFRDASAQDAILHIDECDSFLRDRRGAAHSWEVTQVNEFLQQLEGHGGITCCSTNLFKDLDQASLRRFTFKVEFGWLRPEQAVSLFGALLVPLLGRPMTRDEAERVASGLGRMGRLTPGDFAAVHRRMRILGGFPSGTDLLTELGREVAVKEGPVRVVGF
jgi:transitional endoplasmic reticulum ATPase